MAWDQRAPPIRAGALGRAYKSSSWRGGAPVGSIAVPLSSSGGGVSGGYASTCASSSSALDIGDIDEVRFELYACLQDLLTRVVDLCYDSTNRIWW